MMRNFLLLWRKDKKDGERRKESKRDKKCEEGERGRGKERKGGGLKKKK